MELYNKRMLQILDLFIRNKKVLNSDQIALSIGVSSRTIRNDIKELNQILASYQAMVQSEAGSGYYLQVYDDKIFQMFLKELEHEQIQKEKERVVPSDPQERAYYVIHKLLRCALHSDCVIDPNDLADELFISISTLKKDMKVIDRILERFSLTIKISQKKGIYIAGSEEHIRYCISEFVFQHHDTAMLKDIDFFDDILEQDVFNKIEAILLQVMKTYDMRLTDIAFKNLVVHIVTMLRRASHAQHVDYDEKSIDELKVHKEYSVAQEVINDIQAQLKADISDEIYYLTQHFISSKKFLMTDFHNENENYEFKKEIETILKRIKHDTDVDLSDDTQLINGLVIHLSVALQRLRFHMNIRNDFLDYMKNNYPFAFELAVKASEIIESTYQIRTNENEIGLLAIHFGAALERKGLNEKKDVFKAVIVCASGMATAMLMKERIQQCFANRIQVVKTCPLYEVNQALIDSVDIVLSSVPINNYQSEKIIQTQLLLDQRDIELINNFISHHREEQHYFEEIFKRDLFFTHLKCKSRDEVLDFITDEMLLRGYMNQHTKESVFKREAMATTELGSMVAMPHSLGNDMEEASVSIAILDKPIIWDQEKVQVVLLLNIPRNKYGIWENVFKRLYNYLIRDFGVNKLAKGCSYDEFIRDVNVSKWLERE